ncbi:MAG: hypothetical protein HY758_06590 [Nitrospirae bacterium]|nr:hypothetical protein [Nitrospirota bacterium]
MKIISPKDALEGMVIARDIYNPQGQRLLTKGAVLTTATINAMTRYNITTLAIEDAEVKNDISDKDIAQAKEKIIGHVKKRFNGEPQDQMMKIIFETALKLEAVEYLKCQKKT